jgi:hypothetical protein
LQTRPSNGYIYFPTIGFAVDATSVYWTTSDSVMKVSTGGGPVTTLASAQNFFYSSGVAFVDLAVDAASVYWTTADSVMKVSKDGGAATTLASAQNSPSGIAVDATSVYWTNYYGGSVMKVSTGGGTPTLLASGQTLFPAIIAVDTTSVYWMASGGTMSTPSYLLMKLTPK